MIYSNEILNRSRLDKELFYDIRLSDKAYRPIICIILLTSHFHLWEGHGGVLESD